MKNMSITTAAVRGGANAKKNGDLKIFTLRCVGGINNNNNNNKILILPSKQLDLFDFLCELRYIFFHSKKGCLRNFEVRRRRPGLGEIFLQSQIFHDSIFSGFN